MKLPLSRQLSSSIWRETHSMLGIICVVMLNIEYSMLSWEIVGSYLRFRLLNESNCRVFQGSPTQPRSAGYPTGTMSQAFSRLITMHFDL